jgi:K(+)-stimulated pyrophosphate-energized sodium pump
MLSLNFALLVAPLVGLAAIVFAVHLVWHDLLVKSKGPPEMVEIHDAIKAGANTYLALQFSVAALFVGGITVILSYVLGVSMALSFTLGAVLSGLSAYVGMRVSIYMNVRTANAANHSFNESLDIATKSGTVIGLSLTGLGLIGVGLLYFIVDNPLLLLGMGFGASLVGLFARVGGGIYTKAADIGADLVGKLEESIPEDDPRNAAVIADQVGDNVGDIAGTGSDVFQSYVMALVAAMILGIAIHGIGGLLYPLFVAASGIMASLIASRFISAKNRDAQKAIYKGMYIAVGLVCLFVLPFAWFIFGGLREYLATILGTFTIVFLAWLTLYYTSMRRKPIQDIVRASSAGPAMNIIFGFARGFESAVPSVLVFAASVLLSFAISGIYGLSIVAVGFLSVNATLVAMSSYGPIVDNAKGIMELSGVHQGNALEIMDELDSVGNTTKAVCKVYALGTSSFAQVAIFTVFLEATNLRVINVANPPVVAGLLMGGVLSFLFVSQILKAVGNSAFRMVGEVRRQFAEIPGLKEGIAKADYKKCVSISTRGALKGMFLPAIIAIVFPLAVGYSIGVEAVGGLLAGNLVSTILLGFMMILTGASWDNAKKYVETGKLGHVDTKTYEATVVGDTVGDPFKDAAGPSLDFLMNLIGSMAILFAASFLAYALFA